MAGKVGSLEGKVALVTGGSRGIGAGIARRLAADGASVALTYANSKDQADQVVAEITAAGGSAFAIQADSAVEADVVVSVTETVNRYGQQHQRRAGAVSRHLGLRREQGRHRRAD